MTTGVGYTYVVIELGPYCIYFAPV